MGNDRSPESQQVIKIFEIVFEVSSKEIWQMMPLGHSQFGPRGMIGRIYVGYD